MANRQTIICTLLTWLLLPGWILKKWFMVGTREVTSEWRRLLFEKAWETAEQAGLVVTRSLPYCPVQFLWLSWLIWPHQNTVLTAAVLRPSQIFWIFNSSTNCLLKTPTRVRLHACRGSRTCALAEGEGRIHSQRGNFQMLNVCLRGDKGGIKRSKNKVLWGCVGPGVTPDS